MTLLSPKYSERYYVTNLQVLIMYLQILAILCMERIDIPAQVECWAIIFRNLLIN